MKKEFKLSGKNTMKIKTALAEDNNLLAQSIREKLEFFEDIIEFKYRAANGKILLNLLEVNHNIDVILMDIEMPEMDGITAVKKINELYPQIKIIMLTVFDDEERIFSSIQSGADGYLLKDETPEKIIEGIKMIMEGGAPMSPSIAAKSLKLLRNSDVKPLPKTDFKLSEREIGILEQISKGLDYKKIAENLFISPSTVRKHIENIYKKLQVHNKMEAVQKAQQNKII